MCRYRVENTKKKIEILILPHENLSKGHYFNIDGLCTSSNFQGLFIDAKTNSVKWNTLLPVLFWGHNQQTGRILNFPLQWNWKLIISSKWTLTQWILPDLPLGKKRNREKGKQNATMHLLLIWFITTSYLFFVTKTTTTKIMQYPNFRFLTSLVLKISLYK